MIDITIQRQPNDETCGATCLQAIYNHYNYPLSVDDVISEVERSESGGTLAAYLGKHALQHGFDATIYVNNLNIFDPSWFDKNGMVCRESLIAKLTAQLKYKFDSGIVSASKAYLDYLHLGGNVRFRMLTVQLLRHYFDQKIPILTGLSATYLYFSARELYTPDGVSVYDDIAGTPCGHFVVLCQYDEDTKHIVVADPHRENPISKSHYYTVGIQRLLNAILLGVLTFDANLLIIQPKGI